MDDSEWHKCCDPILPRRTIDGGWTIGKGQIWRRESPEGWQYRQDAETVEEFYDRAW